MDSLFYGKRGVGRLAPQNLLQIGQQFNYVFDGYYTTHRRLKEI